MSRRVLVLVLAGVVLLVAGGWMTFTGGQDEPAPAASATMPSNSDSAPAASTSPPDPEPPTTSTTGTPTPSTSTRSSSSTTAGEGNVEVPPARQRTRMIKAARAFVTDLSTTDRAPKQWWSQVEPHLTAQAAADMKGMDPSWMPAMQLTEGGWVVATDPEAGADSHAGELTSEVVVPTDRGKVSVTVRLDESGRRYQVMQYVLPELQ